MAKDNDEIIVGRFAAYNSLPLDYILNDIENGKCRAGRFIGAIKKKPKKEDSSWMKEKK